MCNLYRLHSGTDQMRMVAEALSRPIGFPEGVPNFQPRDVAITDPAPILRAGSDGVDLVTRRWSWPGPNKKPVYNFRSEGRDFGAGRCLIVSNGFYEFTTPKDPKARRKDRWLFTDPENPILCIAGLWRSVPEIGEAFTMLTTEPGPDVAPYHGRQVAVLTREQWDRWLDPSASVKDLIGPLAAGTLQVEAATVQPA